MVDVAADLAEDWEGFELFYRLGVDPRPLYAAGYPPVHLFRAQGYLTISNALQWRLQYARVIEKAGTIEGVLRLR